MLASGMPKRRTGIIKMSRKQKTRARNQRNEKKDKARKEEAARRLQAYLEKKAGLPITLSINYEMLGMDENTIYEACRRGNHNDCHLATGCTCQDDCDGDKDCLDYSPIDDLP